MAVLICYVFALGLFILAALADRHGLNGVPYFRISDRQGS